MPSLEFQDFTCERDGFPLFQPLSFTLHEGDIVQVAGPNGAGKTTFLRALCGLFSDWYGRLYWDGEAVTQLSFTQCEQLLYFGHQTGVKKTLTARENLHWYFGVQGRAFPGDIEAALAQVGLAGYEDTPCQEMSAGQMRRVGLARLYVTRDPIWVLDEPFTAIDKRGVANLETLIHRHASNGGSVLLTSHQTLSLADLRLIALERFRESPS